jgi:predicted enzyme related to lactoylglutathione lyase
MKRFYSSVFGWSMQQMGPEMGNYVVATTTESTEKGPIKPGAINGGFYQRTDDPVSHAPSLVISVDDLDAHMKKIVAAGGTLSGKPEDIPGVGKWASFIDSEGNRMSVLQPVMKNEGGKKHA